MSEDWDGMEYQEAIYHRQRAEIERLTKDRDQVKRLAEAAVEQNNKYGAEIERLRADMKALTFQLDHTIANLSRNEAEIERLKAENKRLTK